MLRAVWGGGQLQEYRGARGTAWGASAGRDPRPVSETGALFQNEKWGGGCRQRDFRRRWGGGEGGAWLALKSPSQPPGQGGRLGAALFWVIPWTSRPRPCLRPLHPQSRAPQTRAGRGEPLGCPLSFYISSPLLPEETGEVPTTLPRRGGRRAGPEAWYFSKSSWEDSLPGEAPDNQLLRTAQQSHRVWG